MTGSRRMRVVKREGWSRASFVLDRGGKREKKGRRLVSFFDTFVFGFADICIGRFFFEG